MLEIARVLPGSTAARYGLKRGERLVSVNGREIHDSIDFLFHASDERLSLIITGKQGVTRTLRIVKDPDDTLGIEFPALTIRRCRNKCIFCFVDQMPPGCRRSLYVKDDDYRASFLYGNYITLGNLREDDWERIFTQRLSPLYISVHATEPGLRASLMRNRNAPDIMTSLKRLQGAAGATVRVVTARNTLFGPPVTVSGLLSGRDILTAVQGKRLGSLLLIPSNTLNENEGIFLDDMNIADIEAVVGVPVRAVSTFGDVVNLLKISGTAVKRKSK